MKQEVLIHLGLYKTKNLSKTNFKKNFKTNGQLSQ
jgi:hypothetical protein